MGMKKRSTCGMVVSCLVCDKPTSVMHMGVNICRACTVFYKRYHAKADGLRCVIETRACLTYGKNVFWCRRCRLDRLESVLSASRGEDSLSTSNSTEDFKITRIMWPQQTKIQPTSENSVIERIRVNHHVLSIFRLNAELKLRGDNINRADVNEENYVLVPSTYQYMNCGVKHAIIGLFGFSESTFPEFKGLQNSEKWLLIRNFEKLFHCIDSEFRTERRLGKESTNFFASYTTYFSHETVDHFFSDCPDRSHAATAAKTLGEWLKEVIPALWNLFHQIQPTEAEFFALMGLAFWSIETFDASAELLALASRYRTVTIDELMAQYRYSIGEENGVTRVGSLLCLLQEIRRLELNLRNDFEMYRLLGAFDDGKLTYRLQI